jgi:hypothetical protein
LSRFFHVEGYALIFTKMVWAINFYKNGLGHIFGDFSTNSSGHPGCVLGFGGKGGLLYTLLKYLLLPAGDNKFEEF